MFELDDRWSFIVLESIVVVLGVIAGIAVVRRESTLRGRLTLGALIAFWCYLGSIPPLSTALSLSALRSEADSGRAYVAEGQVEDFQAGSWSDHRAESFTIGSEQFTYSTGEITAAFNETSDRGGPVRAVAWLRVTYVRSADGMAKIIKLERRIAP